jgi:hypothetical protein
MDGRCMFASDSRFGSVADGMSVAAEAKADRIR